MKKSVILGIINALSERQRDALVKALNDNDKYGSRYEGPPLPNTVYHEGEVGRYSIKIMGEQLVGGGFLSSLGADVARRIERNRETSL